MRVKANAFEAALAAKGLTGVALAKLLDLHAMTITRVRSGGIVKRPLAIAIASVLEKPLADLFTDDAAAPAEAA